MASRVDVMRARKSASDAAKVKLMTVGIWDDIRRFRKRSSSTGCSPSDYWELYQAVRSSKPREVLECGTGVSTLVLATALHENGSGRLTTMEEQADYSEQCQQIFPAHLKQYVDFMVSPKVDSAYGVFRGTAYSAIPERPYAFVFIDGPSTKTCNLDFVTIARRSTIPVSGIVDGRLLTVFVLQSLLGHKAKYVLVKDLTFITGVVPADVATCSWQTMRVAQHKLDMARWNKAVTLE